ncbi:hypothetical protein PENVUL_c101G06755 [Penicillium vulpinum]|uniref:Carrier domain-containing protein n=1 Tax=Penicillium vulpinum TaxID=29845 RepID=A0A1V6R3M9_9EURO|nr:hypothetical protein PENVUL_c101G06755 [Penicillium vulpinum]
MILEPAENLMFLPFWILGDILYGRLDEQMERYLDKLQKLRHELWKDGLAGGLARYSIGRLIPGARLKTLNTFKALWNDFNDQAYERAMKLGMPDAPPIVKMYRQIQTGQISKLEFLHTMDETLFANLDVTVGNLSWNPVFLAAYPSVQEEIRQEERRVRENLDDDEWKAYLSGTSTMLMASILETARLKPMASFSIPQATPTQRIVGDYIIPEGTQFVVDSHGLNIGDANRGAGRAKYHPRRFLNQNAVSRRYKFWRYGFGPRQRTSWPEDALLLPSPDFEANSARSSAGRVTEKIPWGKVHDFCHIQNISPSIVYHAAWALVLSQYTACNNILFGVVLANRHLPVAGILETVGPLMNMLPICLHIDREQYASEFLQYVSHNFNMLSEYQWSKAEHGFSRNFSSAMAIQFDYESDNPKSPDSLSSHTRIQSGVPVAIFVGPRDRVQFNYSKDRFYNRDIRHMCDAFLSVIGALLIPNQKLESFFTQLIGPSVRQTLAEFGNWASEKTRSYGSETLVSLFTEKCQSAPQSVAVIKGSSEMSYCEIDECSKKVAQKLLKCIAPGDVVCVQADRSTNWIVAALGVVKAQGVYCPMDPNYPPALRDLFCSTANARVFLATDEASKTSKPSSCQIFYSVDEMVATQVPKIGWHSSVNPKANAYMCFTSGSTSFPKGVICTHGGIVGFEKDYVARMTVEPGRKVAQVMSPAFDGSVHQIFSTLSYGGTLILNDSNDLFDNLKCPDVALLTPSLARMLDSINYQNLRAIWLLGEPLVREIADEWASVIPTYNMYGPTETSIGAAYAQIYPGDPIKIGKPTRCVRIYILDPHRNLILPGMTGDVYIAGIQVSCGYIGRQDETGASFFTDSVCSGPGQNMYKTGDRGYWTTRGEVALLGRADRQIKLRGFRLDLNDLEVRILRGYSLATAVALARVDDTLVALVKPEDINIDDFRLRLRDVLPSYAIPGPIRAVCVFPMTNRGKTDYTAIADMFTSCLNKRIWPVASPPFEDIRSKIIDIWRTVLKLDINQPVNDTDHFVHMGGHSIEQLELANRLSTAFSKNIGTLQVVNFPHLRDQVALFSCHTENVSDYGTKDAAQSLSSLRHSNASPIEGVNMANLTDAWNTVLARHDIFRSLYCVQGSQLVRIMSSSCPKVRYVSDIGIQETINDQFDLSKDVPIRVYLSLDLLILVASHIILDLTSLQIVLREVELHVKGGRLPPVTRRYGDITRWNQPAASEDV